MKGILLPLTGIVLVAGCVAASAQSRDGVRTACAGDRQTYCTEDAAMALNAWQAICPS